MGVLFKDREAQALRQCRQSGLARPEPCGAKVEPCPGNHRGQNPAAEVGLGLNQPPVAALILQLIGKGEAGQTAADDETVCFHRNAPQGCLHRKAAGAAQGEMLWGRSWGLCGGVLREARVAGAVGAGWCLGGLWAAPDGVQGWIR